MQELLLHLNSIHPLTNDLQEHLIKILSPKKLSKKDYLLKAGHVCQSICFIQKVLLKCFYHKDQHEVCSWFMKEGDVIVSVESFFNQSPSYESIQAIEDTEVYCISHQQLEFIYKKFPEFNFVARVLLQKYYTLSEQRLFSLRMQKSQERYDYLLEHHPELVLRVPGKYLASYLGLTEVTMSKVRSKA